MIKAGGKNFKTKATLENYCKYVMNNADLDTELRGEWLDVMLDVLRMHEDFDEKVGKGSFSIGVRKCFINFRNRQFYVIREDGTDTDFSYRKCITPTSKCTEVKKSLRAAIREQTIDYKDVYFIREQDSKGYVICPETGLKMKKKDAHIDHYPKQFDEIVCDWANSKSLASKNIVLKSMGDNSAEWEFEDKELVQDFIDYHEKVAEYRVVLNKVNLQRGKSKRFNF